MLSISINLRGENETIIRCSHAIIDRKDREVEIGGAGEIIKRSQPVTHRLLSANMEEDQTGPCSETPHDNSLAL